MTAKHTPGPWTAVSYPGTRPPSYGIKHSSPGRDGGEFCQVTALHCTDVALATAEANARLIAAAPDLLEERDRLTKQRNDLLAACQAALVDLEDCWTSGVRKGYQRQHIKSLPKLRAAISLAIGTGCERCRGRGRVFTSDGQSTPPACGDCSGTGRAAIRAATEEAQHDPAE